VHDPGSTVRQARRVGARVLVVILLAFGALAFVVGPAAADDTKEVSITDTGFGPPTLQIAKGDTVVWTNDGTTTHDASSDDGTFQSGPMSPGQSFPFTFETEGTYVYRSTTDSNLTGSIVVGGAAIGSAQSATPFAATDNVPAAPAAPAQAVAAPDQFAYTGAAQSIALAVLGTVALLFGWAVITGFATPFGSVEPWRILALADPRRLGFTDELMPRGRWRRTPRRSRQADLLPASSSATAPAGPPTRAELRRGGRRTNRTRSARR
jgi:plastocyanin